MKKLISVGIAVVVITGCANGQRQDLAARGWDLNDCGNIPKSTYKVGKTSDYISVKFVNDTGSRVHPAYSDLNGDIKFRPSKARNAIWQDRTYFGTNWVWFSDGRKCLGWSPSQFDWSDSRQFISSLAQAEETEVDISEAQDWMLKDCELLGHVQGSSSFHECLTEIMESGQ